MAVWRLHCARPNDETFLLALLLSLALFLHAVTCNPVGKVQQQQQQQLRPLRSQATANETPWRQSEEAKLSRNSTPSDDLLQRKAKIPGLYNDPLIITPIQGRAQFEQLVLRTNQQVARQPRLEEARQNATSASLLAPLNDSASWPALPPTAQFLNEDHRLGSGQYISIVQFYLATCPDCQGFSPYFKRFIADVGSHWGKLVKIFVVNCNDDQNINLCWSQNPTLTVPLVRWYTFPVLINNPKRYAFPSDLLNVAHRQYIEKQRRDSISLRHATLRFIESTLNRLSRPQARPREGAGSGELSPPDASLSLYNALPIQWKLLRNLGKRNLTQEFGTPGVQLLLDDLMARMTECAHSLGSRNVSVQNVLVFERRQSFVGKTLVADWSNHTCSTSGQSKRKLLVHFSNNMALLERINVTLPGREANQTIATAKSLASMEPLLLAFASPANARLSKLKELDFTLLAWNETAGGGANRVRRDSGSTRDLLAQPSARYYRRQRWHQPQRRAQRHRRAANQSANLIEAENINWAPPELYPGEEALRHRFNTEIARLFFAPQMLGDFVVPGTSDGNLGEIKLNRSFDPTAVVKAEDEDASLVTLTDYYKSLAEIMQKNLLSRAQLDGYQVAASACFLRQLGKHFPFQGGAESHKSVARNYLDLVGRSLVGELQSRTGRREFTCASKNPAAVSDRSKFGRVIMTSDELDAIERNLTKVERIGIPLSSQLKYSYCNGSSEFLRGHTCSLWLLFHSLSVEELLQSKTYNLTSEPSEYVFALDQNQTSAANQTAQCNPMDPEPAYLNASTSDLYVDAPEFALANIINFVRFYLPCTNCAAHFSCMVQRSRLNFEDPSPSDHLLWLWEAHNRVNLRTRGSHSEDPLHPKHLFPVREACPACYLDSAPTLSPKSVRFNRPELIKFLVSRYKRSSIVNNKIRIEDLFKKQLLQQTTNTTGAETPVAITTPAPTMTPSATAAI